MKIGIVLPNWISDAVMATPTLRAIADHYGSSAEVAAIMRPYVVDVLAGSPWLDESILYDHRSRDSELRTWSVVSHLRRRHFDALVLLPNSLRIGSVAWLSGAKRRIGYARYGRGPLLTDKLAAPSSGGKLIPVSAVDYYLKLAT